MRQISAHRPNLLLLVKVSINYLIDADLLAIHTFIAPAMANSGIASFHPRLSYLLAVEGSGFLINSPTVAIDTYLRTTGDSCPRARVCRSCPFLSWYISDVGWYVTPTALKRQVKMAKNRRMKDQY
ncbi:hypothetical protein OX90_11570 [Pseudomonas coronafaciens pv. porri]|uniref:Uncharacterized protein n=1 Tax=Pseudomonas coronafaciens pv. porri TaxID=83964 RepID=A0ABR5JPH6_9PSED|nr:hypothetical protein OX88_04060 [Pseudomonas coronafaciens pv. porri]KOP59414.1 hypothetical protein OX90_11570 [Pseudomonas coronafaciens pv. porri]